MVRPRITFQTTDLAHCHKDLLFAILRMRVMIINKKIKENMAVHMRSLIHGVQCVAAA